MNVSKVLTTGSGGSGAPFLDFSCATHWWRSSWPLHAARPSTMISRPAMMPKRESVMRISLPSRGRLAGLCGSGFLIAHVAIGLDRTLHGEPTTGRRCVLAGGLRRLQRDIVHGQDHHTRQRGHAADEGAELVIGAHHPDGNRLFGVELLGMLRTGLEQLGFQ